MIIKDYCDWCGRLIENGIRGNRKSFTMRNMKYYCSEDCKTADTLPDWICFPVILVSVDVTFIVWNFFGPVPPSWGTVLLLTIMNIFIFRHVYGIMIKRKEIPKGSKIA